MLPVVRWEVLETQQEVLVGRPAFGRLGAFVAEVCQEAIERLFRRLSGAGLTNLMDHGLCLRMNLLEQLVEYIDGLVHPTTLLARFGVDLAQGRLESNCAVTNGQLRWCGRASVPETQEQRFPDIARLPQARVDV